MGLLGLLVFGCSPLVRLVFSPSPYHVPRTTYHDADPHRRRPTAAPLSTLRLPEGIGGHSHVLTEPDYRLMLNLVQAQQNFTVSDPSLPDNPIVYVRLPLYDRTQLRESRAEKTRT